MVNNPSWGKKTFVIRITNDPSRLGVVLFPLFNLISFISAFFFNLRAGVLAGLIILLYAITHRKCLRCFNDPAFLVFYLVNVLSVFAYAFNGRPIAIYVSCITYNLLPMLMFGIGQACNTDERHNPVLKAILFSNLIMVLIGFSIYFSPGLARRVGMYSIETAGITAGGIGYRFGSYLGSLELGSICAVTIPLVLMYDFKYKVAKPAILIIFAVATLLTMQRGAWIVGAVSVVGCMLISSVLDKDGFRSIIRYTLLGLILVGALVYFTDHFMSAGLLRHLEIRIQKLNFEMMTGGSRERQVRNAWKLFTQYPLGFGLGAAGNKASRYHMQVVPDGNLIRILVETGIIGMISFVLLNVKALLNGINQKQYYLTIILALFLAHSVGSNVLDFYYGSFIYWYILGLLSRPSSSIIPNNLS